MSKEHNRGKQAVKKAKSGTNGKRKKSKYPNLNPKLNLSSRKEEVEDVASYVDQLNDEEKTWLNKFMGEYVGASLDFKNLENNLHNTQELKKSCTDRNNARNRCIHSRAKTSGMLKSTEDLQNKELNTLIPENSFEVKKEK